MSKSNTLKKHEQEYFHISKEKTWTLLKIMLILFLISIAVILTIEIQKENTKNCNGLHYVSEERECDSNVSNDYDCFFGTERTKYTCEERKRIEIIR